MSYTVEDYAHLVLRALKEHDQRTEALRARIRGKTATIGFIEAGEWVPLFRLSNPSDKVNVMSLDVRHGSQWAKTFVRGVPDTLVDELAGPLAYIWDLNLDGWEPTP